MFIKAWPKFSNEYAENFVAKLYPTLYAKEKRDYVYKRKFYKD